LPAKVIAGNQRSEANIVGYLEDAIGGTLSAATPFESVEISSLGRLFQTL